MMARVAVISLARSRAAIVRVITMMARVAVISLVRSRADIVLAIIMMVRVAAISLAVATSLVRKEAISRVVAIHRAVISPVAIVRIRPIMIRMLNTA